MALPETSADDATIADLMAHRGLTPGSGGVADMHETVAFRPLLLRAIRKAWLLRRVGVTRGTYVPVAMRNRWWSAIAVDYLACAWLGAVAVLTDSAELLEAFGVQSESIEWAAENVDSSAAARAGDRPRPDDPLDVVFSSGTTGIPKPTVFRHREWTYLPWGATHRTGTNVVHYGIPFGTSTGVHGIFLKHLAAGVLSVAARSAEEVVELVERHDCRELVVTPYSLRNLLQLGDATARLARISTIKVVAGPVAGHLAGAAIDAFPDARVLSIYGATELGPAIFVRLVRRGDSTALGSPGPGTMARVVDGHGAVAPPGTVGEIQVSHSPGGRSATDPSRTWVSTGDLGRADELGRIILVGRAKEILFLQAGRMTPGEIEDRLLEHPAIKDCGVTAINSVNGCDRLGVCVVPKAPENAEEIRAALARFDPAFDTIRFVSLIPRTALGKPIRAQLWQLLNSVPPQEDLGNDQVVRGA